MINKIIKFFKEVKAEMKKTTWLTRKEVLRYTLIVLAATLVIAAFLGGLDTLFLFLIDKFII